MVQNNRAPGCTGLSGTHSTTSLLSSGKPVIRQPERCGPICFSGRLTTPTTSRPVVDAGWVEHSRQVGTTGTTVAPKLYIACGISGAVQHLAGMKKSEFVVAVNTDRDAPIGEVANVLVVADLKQFLPILTEKLQNR